MERRSNDYLVHAWVNLGVELDVMATARHQIEVELITRMQDVGATAMDNPVYDVRLEMIEPHLIVKPKE